MNDFAYGILAGGIILGSFAWFAILPTIGLLHLLGRLA